MEAKTGGLRTLEIFIAVQFLCLALALTEFDFLETFYHTLIAYLIIDLVVVSTFRKLVLNGRLSRFFFYLSPVMVLMIITYLLP
jgi:hypothetical protein